MHSRSEELFALALETRPEDRAAFLAGACGGDEALLREVERMLADLESADGLFEDGETEMQTEVEVAPRVPQARGAGGFEPGSVLAGRYRIVAPLGKGGMGEVYRADDLTLGLPVALKFLPAALANQPALLEALHNEVRQARRVSHRQIARVHDIGEAGGLHFLSMEYIEGEDLASLLRRIGRLPRDKALELARQLGAGLLALHAEGLLHLDLKPANLMIDGRGELRITDFGLTRLSAQAEAEKRRVGTPAYMAPEQLLRGETSAASDLYAMGLVLFEMATGRRVHEGRSLEDIVAWHRESGAVTRPSALVPSLPAGIEALILRCLERDPARRPASVQEVLSALDAVDSSAAAIEAATRPVETKSGKRLAALMFTDLVGSVALQQRLGTAAYMEFVARHDEIFQECLAGSPDARILNETGDGFLVRFDDPADAVNTALRLQLRLHDEACLGQPMRIRIGLHLGVVTEMEERIRGEKRAVGMPINLTARIMDLADGGQILMTRAVYEDARNYVRDYPEVPGKAAPAPLRWESHGLYAFKGNPEPIEIFEAGAEGVAPFLPPESGGKARRAGSSAGESPDTPQAATAATASFEVLSPESIDDSDILLNYAAIDDRPLSEGRPGWVSELHRNLQVRVEQLSGEKVKIARLPEASRPPAVEARVRERLPKFKAMVSVISPPFLHSDVCRREVESFWDLAEGTGGRWVEDKARLLKVLKTAVSDDEMPAALANIFSPLAGFEFFEKDPETGRIREFDEAFGVALKQRFFERVYDLAYDVSQVLRLLKQVEAQPLRQVGSGMVRHRVYLATTTSDVAGERDRIKRELLERGHHVLPDGPLPMLATDVERTVRECLADCTIAVHLLGRHYGTTPEDSAESLPALQVRLTADQAQGQKLQRLIWMPGTDNCADERQRQFLSRVQEDPRIQQGAEVIEGNLNLLKNDLIRCLTPPEEKKAATPSAAAGTASEGPRKVYLICDPKDESEIEALEDYLFDQGLEVCLPAFDGDDADAAALHQENLLSCDAVLVYYGAAPKAWVDIKLRELLKAAGYGRETPIAVQGVYIAPPDDRRKERFRSHQASVIHQPGAFAPSPELDAFVGQVKEVCA